MSIANVVVAGNLGPEFELGTTVANQITICVDGTTVLRDPVTGCLSSPAQAETVTSMTYDAATTTLTYTDENGNATNVDLAGLAADIYVSGGTFDPATGVLTLTDNDAGTPDVTIDLSTLLGVSADAGNLLADGTDGKPLLTPTALCTAMEASCYDLCQVTDVFSNVIGEVWMTQP